MLDGFGISYLTTLRRNTEKQSDKTTNNKNEACRFVWTYVFSQCTQLLVLMWSNLETITF